MLQRFLQEHPEWSKQELAQRIGRSLGWVKKWKKRLREVPAEDATVLLGKPFGRKTPGKLAELTGLTTGTITGVIDRLEKAGYARRERDLHDRRKVIIQPIPEHILPKLTPILRSFEQAMGTEFASLYTDQDMVLILDFIERSMRVLQAETAKLQAGMVHGEVVAQANKLSDERAKGETN
jgi:DNA-binding MarR family transcriptional regulator